MKIRQFGKPTGAPFNNSFGDLARYFKAVKAILIVLPENARIQPKIEGHNYRYGAARSMPEFLYEDPTQYHRDLRAVDPSPV
jgi:hypothetical protein